MGKINGMDLAKTIRKTNNEIPIVFITGLKEYVFKSFSVAAIQYLVKPIEKKDIFDCLDRILQINKIKKYYLFKNLEQTVRIPTTDIIYIKMSSNNATMVTTKKEYTFRKTISQILTELDDDLFVKCHKSYIINIRHIESPSRTFALMSNDKTIPLSKNMAGEISDMFNKYNMNKI